MADLQLATRSTLRDAVQIRKICTASIDTNNAEALRPVFGHDQFEMADPASYFRRVFGMPLQQGDDI
ncbi:hypothetical protein AYJ54_05190 [Bradyrhizobium centrolobii]|uniref:Uncharacterized protein n=1 Tax=Bradyrhizobium centrolobii TaxID=1505087 RepID=A0A176Z9L9_9BRAD|nr:hypothetical protein AYJ54_05190 [Bradyrhizobium centrolobii]